MPRSKNKVAAHRRRKRVLEQAKGYWGRRSKVYTVAKNHVEKGLLHSFRDRKLKKRVFRKLWITRINAAARVNGTTYSRLIHALDAKGILINRKILANLAVENPATFTELVKFSTN
ncbi:MAG: 50S ribosomal protein L20 [Ignavibacteria bacterium RIFOXYB2_FULL_35_12]|nr:MAG: 50S ribosomal protein L20 [Ignavibacteria bacterium GWA2_36_19]OGU50666.1 MAG: 50S ribosomal protein L20 [Ignavibacteria bacterium GWC2_35_8]OGU60350.1 MAG: 50S ribosomal protein L20 [Ignavibacteria bacterium GWF2_35_20]OGU81459.1 MAG: 50S ribosomal protein L20 [Ignavibacteria bacterium RIFOXYA2_FULL_35_9]OGU90439.1 MAG: 50S ribosomal protein L20 [Ignavibacteria bacterium RIFOXYA12_FULL_35_25]OGU94268.1 MAG: 50S ribosomal protein L20 [Ignavibacteria bacterium RIFOXYB12_FULL_35_14]OGU9